MDRCSSEGPSRKRKTRGFCNLDFRDTKCLGMKIYFISSGAMVLTASNELDMAKKMLERS